MKRQKYESTGMFLPPYFSAIVAQKYWLIRRGSRYAIFPKSLRKYCGSNQPLTKMAV